MNNKFRISINIKNFFLILMIISFTGLSRAVTVNGKTILVNNTETYSIKFQINTDTGNDDMGGATIVIRYDSSQLFFNSAPVPGEDFIYHNFSGGNYSIAGISNVLGNQLWLNIELNTDNQGMVVTGNDNWTDLVTLHFIKKTEAPVNPLLWDAQGIFWCIYDGNNLTKWTPGNFSGVIYVEEEPVSPDSYELFQNYPNPFNPSTSISFNIKKSSDVILTVYNMLGEAVETLINSELNQGYHKINFNAADLSSGIYFYKLSVNNNYTAIKKMILLK